MLLPVSVPVRIPISVPPSHSPRGDHWPSPCKVVRDLYNQRLKLIGAHPAHLSEIRELEQLDGLGKVIVYARGGNRSQWQALGFRSEGTIPGFFSDAAEATIWASYPRPERGQEKGKHLHDTCLLLALSKPAIYRTSLPQGYSSQLLGPEEAAEAARLLRAEFPVYRTPLSNDHLLGAILWGTSLYRGVRAPDGALVAVASAELDGTRRNAKVTDCATRPDQRGRGLMAHLISQLESDLRRDYEITDLYTLARAQEVGMNCVFRKLGYSFQGRLINNCRMPFGWESMHIWCKCSDDR
ncbi:hypothetical protein ABS71_14000 [bacterium SCN 62-11]|nr:MAG: hypothetical protein ABS71_14000 [bacterium SCN 62-11]